MVPAHGQRAVPNLRESPGCANGDNLQRPAPFLGFKGFDPRLPFLSPSLPFFFFSPALPCIIHVPRVKLTARTRRLFFPQSSKSKLEIIDSATAPRRIVIPEMPSVSAPRAKRSCFQEQRGHGYNEPSTGIKRKKKKRTFKLRLRTICQERIAHDMGVDRRHAEIANSLSGSSAGRFGKSSPSRRFHKSREQRRHARCPEN